MLVDILAIIVVGVALLYRFGKPYLARRQTRNVADWPVTEATIQSGKMELVERIGHLRGRVPFFEFSYLVHGEYHSGRFGLRLEEDRGTNLVRELVGTKINVSYDPRHPNMFCVPDELSVDGFRIKTVSETELTSEH
ncbi:MAG: DUF3592 domain-containing protein [Acidobacteria bacterium]|nr:DUF3592 domain-containing protein [Acidobacteriota bacterium]